MELSNARRADLEKQGYRLVGNHSAIKVCEWSKQSLRDCGFCYKQQFYHIDSHRCCQMTPALPTCNHRCIFCWRDIAFTNNRWDGPVDNPKEIVDGCIKAHKEFLIGFRGSKKTNLNKLEEAYSPNQFAISLSGEPTFYPRLPELIDEITSRKDEITGKNFTAFLVSNGTNPDALKQLINHEPTQLYITLPAPNEEVYKKTCYPLEEGSWNKIMESIQLLKQFKCNTVLRMTLVKDINMTNSKEFAKIIKDSNVKYVEVKAYMWVGYSKERLEIDKMPRHYEIVEFAQKIVKLSGYKIKDEKKESRVVLLER